MRKERSPEEWKKYRRKVGLLVGFPLLLYVGLGASCLLSMMVPPTPVYVPGPETPGVASRATGRLVYGSTKGYFCKELATGVEQGITPKFSIYCASEPADDGTFVLVENDMMGRHHFIVVYRHGARTVYKTRVGDALWGTFKTHPIGNYSSLSKNASQFAILQDLVPIQYPGALCDSGNLTVYDLNSKAERIVARDILDFPISWMPDQQHILATNAFDSHGRAVRTVVLIDVSSGAKEYLAKGDSAWPSPSGNTVFIGDYRSGRWFELKTKSFSSKVVNRRAIAAIDDHTILIEDYPTKGTPAIIEYHGKGPRLAMFLKVYDTDTDQFATVASGITSHARCAYR